MWRGLAHGELDLGNGNEDGNEWKHRKLNW